MEPRLLYQFRPLERGLRRTRLRRKLALAWAGAAAAAWLLFLLRGECGHGPRWICLLPLAGGAVAAAVLWRRESKRPVDYKALAAAVERNHPEVRHLFSAALEQEPNPDSGQFGFLQWQVIDQVLSHPGRLAWEKQLEREFAVASWTHAAGFAVLVAGVLALGWRSAKQQSWEGSWFSQKIGVNPGDTQIERGSSLVISARFSRTPPPEAMLVLVSGSGLTRRIPMQRELADPIFGASLAEVAEDALYHVEYQNRKTRDYHIRVFDYPELLRGDASLVFPDYTHLTNQVIRDTRRITAVEGTRLTYTMQLNKPVTRARFLGAGPPLPLTVDSNAAARLNDFVLSRSGRYSLELVDWEGRTNKLPTDFSIQVVPNRRPDLKLLLPAGDQRVSKLEELQLQAQASDDFGVLKYGIGCGVVGRDPRIVELGGPTPANEKRQFGYLIPLEKEGVDVDQVVSYFAWADDYGPDGKVRRTVSDIFFAEVRPFEEIYRRDQSGQGANAGQGQQNNQAAQLAQLQKEIVIATWKLQQEKAGSASPAAASP